MLLVNGSVGVVGHVGDSRAYLVREGRIHQLTRDHELTEELGDGVSTVTSIRFQPSWSLAILTCFAPTAPSTSSKIRISFALRTTCRLGPWRSGS